MDYKRQTDETISPSQLHSMDAASAECAAPANPNWIHLTSLEASCQFASEGSKNVRPAAESPKTVSRKNGRRIEHVLGAMVIEKARFYLIKWEGLDETHISWEESSKKSRLRRGRNRNKIADFNREFGRASPEQPKILSPTGEMWATERRRRGQSALSGS